MVVPTTKCTNLCTFWVLTKAFTCNPNSCQNIYTKIYITITPESSLMPFLSQYLRPIPKTNHSFFFCHRLDLPVLELHIYNYTIWIILCKASFTSYSFGIYPYCCTYHFFCFFVHCMDILWFVYSFSCWWIIGLFPGWGCHE